MKKAKKAKYKYIPSSVHKAADGVTDIHVLHHFSIREDTLTWLFNAAIYGLCRMLQEDKPESLDIAETWDVGIQGALLDFKTIPDATPELLEFVETARQFRQEAILSTSMPNNA
ncbi:hypothetical protein ADP71_18090 [Vitreoscilla sp. C1]|uniref:hypothetical protein n=1 Tax=Vitreoscilla sp. (strain C1) TaxID=96942 RepID=UPI000CDCB645|nr:hypothetical protein [Vitreoscilla sp. C1]AUZ05334.1 hypothetical protein ADP71_18090 [Vitreoscilla sp. C1]